MVVYANLLLLNAGMWEICIEVLTINKCDKMLLWEYIMGQI